MLRSIIKNKLLQSALGILFWAGLWQVLSLLVNKEVLLPSPLAVLNRIFTLGATADFWSICSYSLFRIFAGFLAGTVFGVLCAVLVFRCRLFAVILPPLLSVLKSTPIASFIIIILVWLGRENVPSLTSFIMVLPIVSANVLEGLNSADGKLAEVARVYRFSRRQKILHLYFPSALPFFFSACKSGLGLSWKAGIAAEVLCTPKYGIGTRIYESKIYLESADLFAWTVVVIVLSFLIETLVTGWISKWQKRGRLSVYA